MTQYTLNTPLACCEISSPAPFAQRLLAQFKRTIMRRSGVKPHPVFISPANGGAFKKPAPYSAAGFLRFIGL